MLDLFTELQICGLSLGLLLASDSEEILINKRVDIAFKVDLFLDLVHCLVEFVCVDIDAKNSLLKFLSVSKLEMILLTNTVYI